MSLRYVNARGRYSCRADDAMALATYGKRTLDSDAKVWATLKRKGYDFEMKKRLFMEYEVAFNMIFERSLGRLNMATAAPESSTLSLLLMLSNTVLPLHS